MTDPSLRSPALAHKPKRSRARRLLLLIGGAGALVRSDIPPFAIAVGVPARVVGSRRVSDGSS